MVSLVLRRRLRRRFFFCCCDFSLRENAVSELSQRGKREALNRPLWD